MRRIWLLTLLVGCAPDGPAQPNVIFIFTDDHGAQAISAYGSRINETPNIDGLADEGMLFHNALVANSITTPPWFVL